MDSRTILKLIVLAGLAFQIKALPTCSKEMNGMTFEARDASQLEREASLTAEHVSQCGPANLRHNDLVICKDGKWKRVACK